VLTCQRLRARASLLTAVLLLGSAARAQDDLTPEEGTFAGYQAPEPYRLVLREALLGEEHYRLCQVVTIPAFTAEWAVYMIRNDPGDFTVISRTVKHHFWDQMMKSLAREKNGSHKFDGPSQAAALAKIDRAVVTRTAPLDQPTAKLLDRLCARVIRRARYPRKPISGFDGVQYHVATWGLGGFPSAKTWSPKKGTLPADFVELEEALKRLTEVEEGARAKVVAELRERAGRLNARLDALERTRP
jgi:hypothetical protein